MRHLAVGQLWVQEHLRWGSFKLYKVRRDRNPADLCTKCLARMAIDRLLEICGIFREAGRAARLRMSARQSTFGRTLDVREERGLMSEVMEIVLLFGAILLNAKCVIRRWGAAAQ